MVAFLLTSDDHHAGGEYFLVVRFGGDVAETDAGHAGHGEVEGRDVHGLAGRPVDQLGRIALVGPDVGVRRLSHVGQLPEPAVLDAVVGVRAADRVPDAGQPVGHQHVEAEQQDQHGRPVLQIAVQLAHHAAQSQQSHHLQSAEQTPDTLDMTKRKRRGNRKFNFISHTAATADILIANGSLTITAAENLIGSAPNWLYTAVTSVRVCTQQQQRSSIPNAGVETFVTSAYLANSRSIFSLQSKLLRIK